MGLEELDLLEAFSQAATLAELRRYAEPVNRNETAGSRAGEELDNVATARELGLDEDGVLRPCQLRDLRGKDVVGAPPAGAAPRESRSRLSLVAVKRFFSEPPAAAGAAPSSPGDAARHTGCGGPTSRRG